MSQDVTQSHERAAQKYAELGWGGVEEMVAAMSIMRAQDIIRTHYSNALREFGLTFTRYEALLLLFFSEDGCLPLSRTSTALNVHPTSTTYTIDSLEKAGLVVREAHPTDRRTTMVRITDEGRRVAQAATDNILETGHGLSGLSEQDVQAITDALSGLRSVPRGR